MSGKCFECDGDMNCKRCDPEMGDDEDCVQLSEADLDLLEATMEEIKLVGLKDSDPAEVMDLLERIIQSEKVVLHG